MDVSVIWTLRAYFSSDFYGVFLFMNSLEKSLSEKCVVLSSCKYYQMVPKTEKFQILTCLFYIQFWCIFFLWIDWAETFGLYVHIFPLSLFIDEVNNKRTAKAKFQNVNFLILHSILMQFFVWNDHLYGLLMDHKHILLFHFKRGIKFRIVGRYI